MNISDLLSTQKDPGGGKPVFDPDRHLETINRLFNFAGDKEHELSMQSRRLDLTNIALSVVTAGGFWALLGETPRFKEPITWAGALIGTVLLALQLFQASRWDPQKRRTGMIDLYKKIGNELARLTANRPTTPNRIENAINNLKTFLGELHNLGYRSPLVP